MLLCILGKFPSTTPPGGLYLEGRFNGGFFFRYEFRRLIFGGSYTWRGLFSEFYGNIVGSCCSLTLFKADMWDQFSFLGNCPLEAKCWLMGGVGGQFQRNFIVRK